jgi:hypothetical protein
MIDLTDDGVFLTAAQPHWLERQSKCALRRELENATLLEEIVLHSLEIRADAQALRSW